MIDQIFRDYGDEYLHHFIENIPFEHIKVLRAIQRCNMHKCDKCGGELILISIETDGFTINFEAG